MSLHLEIAEFGSDTIKFKPKPSCLILVRGYLDMKGYSKFSADSDSVYSANSRDEKNTVRLDISGSVCSVAFHYTDPSARDQCEDVVSGLRKFLEDKLEMVNNGN